MLRNEVKKCSLWLGLKKIAPRYEIMLKLGNNLKDIFQG
jgi:hypothetical protein